jgi:hypothetical protein
MKANVKKPSTRGSFYDWNDGTFHEAKVLETNGNLVYVERDDGKCEYLARGEMDK